MGERRACEAQFATLALSSRREGESRRSRCGGEQGLAWRRRQLLRALRRVLTKWPAWTMNDGVTRHVAVSPSRLEGVTAYAN